MNAGSRHLGELLAALDPALDERPYRFTTLPEREAAALVARAIGMVREPEGVTLVLAADEAGNAEPAVAPRWARITLRVGSDLAAVGLMAAVAGRLAALGIAVNPLAGFHHDHLLVPWERRAEALAALLALASEHGR